MNLPKKLIKAPKSLCFINDERERPALFTSNDYDYNESFKEEIIKRYNRYNKLVIALVVVSTLLGYAASTIVNLYRFKLV